MELTVGRGLLEIEKHDSPLFMSKISRKLRHYHSVLGLKGVFAFLFAKMIRRKLVYSARLPEFVHPLYIRLATTDLSVFRQVLVEKHYDFNLPREPKTIVDAGANIGLASVFFAQRWPNALIAAIEPEDSNFGILERNVAPYPCIRPLKAGLWLDTGEIELVDPGLGNHGFQIRAATSDLQKERSFIKSLSVNSIMDELKVDFIDILKLDIEGAEAVVFANASSWINQVGVVMAELHDHIRPGCTAAFEAATQNFRKFGTRGEIEVRIHPEYLDAPAACH